jgi:branched-chain amino acid transport system permease protein
MLGIPMSVDFLAMILLGGMQTVMGAVVGAAAFHAIKDVFMPLTDFWRFFLGAAIIALVLIFPRGLGGAYGALRAQATTKAVRA